MNAPLPLIVLDLSRISFDRRERRYYLITYPGGRRHLWAALYLYTSPGVKHRRSIKYGFRPEGVDR